MEKTTATTRRIERNASLLAMMWGLGIEVVADCEMDEMKKAVGMAMLDAPPKALDASKKSMLWITLLMCGGVQGLIGMLKGEADEG